MQLPNTLDQLYDFVEHFKAGLCFALNNIASFATKLEGDELLAFQNIDQDTLGGFMAASHNNPNLASQAMHTYLRLKKKYTYLACAEAIAAEHTAKLKKTGGHHIDVDISVYIKKTKSNHKGLREYLAAAS